MDQLSYLYLYNAKDFSVVTSWWLSCSQGRTGPQSSFSEPDSTGVLIAKKWI